MRALALGLTLILARADGGPLALDETTAMKDARDVVSRAVAEGRAEDAGRALHAALGGVELPPLCGDDVDKGCALVRVQALAHGVILEGGIGATDVLRSCGPVKRKPVLIGRTGPSLRTYAGVKRTGSWEQLDGLLVEAFTGGGSEVCNTVLVESFADDATLSHWRALERAARAAGYVGVTPPAWARDVLPFPQPERVPSPFGGAGDEESPKDSSGDDKSSGFCFGLCG